MELKKIKIKVFLLTILFLMLGITISKAGYSASNPTVKSGENINITISSSVALDAYNIDLQSYNGLTFKSCSKSADGAMVNVNGGSIGYMNMSGNTKTLGTYTFKAPNVTEKKTYEVSFSINQGEATVKAKVIVNPNNTGSSNAGLSSSNNNTTSKTESAKISSVVVNGIKIKESLNVTNKESVSVKVTSSNGENITIYNSLTKKSYTAKSGSSISVKVDEGTNTLTFTLSNGAKATRKIYSQKEEEVKPNNIEEETPEEIKLILKSLEIKGVKDEEEEKVDLELTPKFSSEVYEYTINIPEEQNDITKLDIKAVGDKENFNIEITGNENISDGENVVTITIKSPDTEKIATYKIKVNKQPKTVETIAYYNTIEEDNPIQEEPNNNLLTIGIIAFTTIVAIAGIVFAVIEYKYGKNKKNEDDFGEIPYSKLGYETNSDEENEKIDILKETEQEDIQSKEEIEQTKDDTEAIGEEVGETKKAKKTKKRTKTEEKDDNVIEELYKKRNKKDDLDDLYNFDTKGKKKGKHF